VTGALCLSRLPASRAVQPVAAQLHPLHDVCGDDYQYEGNHGSAQPASLQDRPPHVAKLLTSHLLVHGQIR
jgi:hypothetical protein